MAFRLCECACASLAKKHTRTLCSRRDIYFCLCLLVHLSMSTVWLHLCAKPLHFFVALAACQSRDSPLAFQLGSCSSQWCAAADPWECHLSFFSRCRPPVWSYVPSTHVSRTKVSLLHCTTPKRSHPIG